MKNIDIQNLRLLIFGVICLLILGCGLKTNTEKRPNILWIVSEDNSPLLGAYDDSLATTPNLDRLAKHGVVYENAFATTPVCAPSRFTLITGMYANVMGTGNMRSRYPIPEFVRFFPTYLREAGYYTTNNSKKDYNTIDQPDAWNESSDSASYRNRAPGQPFFHVKNIAITHESRLHDPIDTLIHDPDRIPIPPYHPATPRVKRDWAHYYDQITKMDARVGEILNDLEESGEADHTIVFYYSDHGGVLPRSKRYMFESGLHIPLIVYFPPKYAHLSPGKKRTGRLVSFVDFAPTVLSLAGVDPPDYMHGKAFLGRHTDSPRQYIHAYRGRMDERYDLIRAVRDKQFLYIHNYMPQRIYGQHLAYLWKAPSMQSWYEEFKQGTLDPVQRRFFEPKPPEELYDISSDPHNVNNLTFDPAYRAVLQRLRRANSDWMHAMKDLGFIPEGRIDSLRQDRSLYEAVRNKDIPIDQIIETAEQASWGGGENPEQLAEQLDHANPSVRFWAAMGLAIAKQGAKKYEKRLLKHRNDSSVAVRIAVAEALVEGGNRNAALAILEASLDHSTSSAKLRSLNIIEALDLQNLPPSLIKKVQRLQENRNEQGGYIRGASATILNEK